LEVVIGTAHAFAAQQKCSSGTFSNKPYKVKRQGLQRHPFPGKDILTSLAGMTVRALK
jgi:hypothetical protein